MVLQCDGAEYSGECLGCGDAVCVAWRVVYCFESVATSAGAQFDIMA